MSLRGKKLGLLVSAPPHQPSFTHALNLAEAALVEGVDVYLYCIDEAVRGMAQAQLSALAAKGLKLYACAYGLRQRKLPLTGDGVFAGLGALSDVIASTDRFLAFN